MHLFLAASGRSRLACLTLLCGIYPTRCVKTFSEISWGGVLAYPVNDTTTWVEPQSLTTLAPLVSDAPSRTFYDGVMEKSPLPPHLSMPVITGTVDPKDPLGKCYSLVPYPYIPERDPNAVLVNFLWPHDSQLSVIVANGVTGGDYTVPLTQPQEFASTVSALLLTSTSYISDHGIAHDLIQSMTSTYLMAHPTAPLPTAPLTLVASKIDQLRNIKSRALNTPAPILFSDGLQLPQKTDAHTWMILVRCRLHCPLNIG